MLHPNIKTEIAYNSPKFLIMQFDFEHVFIRLRTSPTQNSEHNQQLKMVNNLKTNFQKRDIKMKRAVQQALLCCLEIQYNQQCGRNLQAEQKLEVEESNAKIK